MAFVLYELARNPQIQDCLHDEISTVLTRYDNKLSYEALQEMTYLDCVIHGDLQFYFNILTIFLIVTFKFNRNNATTFCSIIPV